MNQETMIKALDLLYSQSINGLGKVSPPIDEFANDYLSKHKTTSAAARSMFKHQIAKCTTSGFISGFGGIITLPISVPANIGSVLYVQMRMIACAAYMGGYDTESDQVRTFVYACLAGISVNNVVKKFGVDFTKKLALKGLDKIPGKVLTKINQRIGFRLITKFGEKGLINLAKIVPVVGAGVNGGLDLVETRAIAKRAYKMFIKNDYSVGDDILISQDLDD